VGAGGEGLRERVFTLVGRHRLGERGRVDGALVGEFFRERDRLAVVVERHQHGHVFLRAADAEVHAVDQAVQHVRHVELAVDQLVAHAGPRGLLGGDDLDAVLLVELQHRSHHHRRTVGERNEADADFLLLRRVGAGRERARHGRSAGEGNPALDERPPLFAHGNLTLRHDHPFAAENKKGASIAGTGDQRTCLRSDAFARPSKKSFIEHCAVAALDEPLCTRCASGQHRARREVRHAAPHQS